jgi:hypothetical protein
VTEPRVVSELSSAERARWLYRSGMRCLSMGHPIQAEFQLEDHLLVQQEVDKLIQAGVPVENGYNSKKASLVKDIDHVTHVMGRDQHGMTFSDGRIPPELQALPMIEVPREERLSQARLATVVWAAAKSLPPQDYSAAETRMRVVMKSLQPLTDVAGKGASAAYFKYALRRAVEQESLGLVSDLALRIYPLQVMSTPESDLINKFEFDMMVAYRDLQLNCYPVSALLLLCAISREAAPAEPFRRAFDKFVQMKVEVPLEKLLVAMFEQPGSLEGVGRVINHLIFMGRTAWNSMPEGSDVDDFYRRAFMAMPYFQACGHMNSLLLQITTDSETRALLQAQFNEADEFIARVHTALSYDFMNAIDLRSIDGSRTAYNYFNSQRPRFAKLTLQKWLYDEKLFPEYWEVFVTGATDRIFWDKPKGSAGTANG